ncbi:phosphatidylglycerol lysyltransferase domain-containing protein [Nocardia takedensis]
MMLPTCGHVEALAVLEDLGQHSSAFLALNADNEFFTVPGIHGLIAYRPQGRGCWIQFTGAVGPDDSARRELDAAFAAAAARRRKRVIAVQLAKADAERAAEAGWVVNQLGSSYSIDLSSFSLRGQRFVKTRNMISRSKREGVVVTEATADTELLSQLDAIDSAWLRGKGRHVKELRLMIGERGGPLQDRRRLFLAEVDGRVVAYVSYVPVYGAQHGWLYDLTRRVPDAPPGVVEHIFAFAAETLRADGADWIHLGFTPFVGIEPEHEFPQAASRMLALAATQVRRHGQALYPADSQLAFKSKWRPHQVSPEYIAFPSRIRARDVWHLARATNAL